MKKLTLVMALMLAVAASNAQGFRIGLAGGFNSTWLFNKNVSDAGDDLDFKSSFGGQVGISALYNFKESVGISLDILYNSVNQKYTLRPSSNTTYESEVSLSTIALPLLFRYTGEKGPYFEVGPEFDIINSGTGDNFFNSGISADVPSETINGMSIAAVIGFGVDIKASEQLTITTGLRFAWGLGDVYKKGASGKDFIVPTKNYESTNTAVGGLHLGVAYTLGSKK